LFSCEVRPSTDPESYASDSDGASPPVDGAAGNGYEYENEPDCSPTTHESDAFSGVALYDPPSPVPVDDTANTIADADADAAADDTLAKGAGEACGDAGTTTGALGSAVTTAVSLCVSGSALDFTGVATRHARTAGVLSTHAGYRTSPTREAKSPPNAFAIDE
jgi:hypothetical protein